MADGASFLGDLSKTDQALVRSRCISRNVRKGEIVVHQGAVGREFYIVVSGRLRISALSAEGREVSIGVLEPDDTFGEMSMLDAEPRSASVTAMEACELLVLERATFDSLVEEHPQLAVRLMVILSQRLRRTTEVYEDAVFLDVSARLAKLLLQFSRVDAEGGHAAPEFDFKVSQYELGTLVNASRESVNKLIRDWEARSLIQRDHGKILLLDPKALDELARGGES